MASFNALSTALSTSWDIFKTSTRLLSHRKALLFFPIAAAATLAVFIVALIVLGLLLPPNIDKTSPQFVRAALAIDYVILLYVALFWQTALITQTTAALQGEKPSFTRGFAAARRYRTRLLPWVLIDTAVTWGFGIIDENLLYVGSLVHVLFIGRFLDLMWRAVSFQVLPTIVLRNVGTVEAIKTCKKTLRSMLSRNVLAQLGLRIFILVLVLPGVGMLFAAAAAGHGVLSGVLGLAGGLWIAAAILYGATVSGIYQTVLYRSAEASNHA
ncbi:DUF6159 family protein [Mycobacteroides abscessus]|uniref:Transmembrane protein n=4 Tax=Mycobacteroides abscessus TaxID=36809 RepID=B1MDE1_MYCA9|nr:DUF6159 family protein [Mycobacteroides abscessus]EUA61819.1 putative membrane protein [Mycobacteroides abscessus 1948]ALM17341.1 hypothetical protein AOY11_14855 [Mycobacteroides abscessus]AMU46556.1 hypothetical protein A3O00_15980 [Mycobacteroides abscessus]AMU51451.1 hypothetical protein A3O01_15910 [Mycobacteroides abscessus]ANO10134.1 hypothetical protein BAB76_15920 [Mycobacteroides abscessus]